MVLWSPIAVVIRILSVHVDLAALVSAVAMAGLIELSLTSAAACQGQTKVTLCHCPAAQLIKLTESAY